MVGGGPAGLAAAAAALRGHTVELWERSVQVGGLVNVAASLTNRERFGLVRTYYEGEVWRLGVRVRVGTTARASDIRAARFDAVILATGSRAVPEPIPGLATVWSIPDAVGVAGQLGSHVVVKDVEGGWSAAAIAEHVARSGRKVSVVTTLPMFAQHITLYSRLGLTKRLGDLGVKVHVLRRIVRAEGTDLVIADLLTGEEEVVPQVSDVISAGERVAETSLYDELKATGVAGELVGDALAPRTALEAIFEGYRAGRLVGETRLPFATPHPVTGPA